MTFAFVLLLALNSWAKTETKIESFTGHYQAVDSSCGYELATISFDRKTLNINLKGSEPLTHHVELKHLGRTIRQNMSVENLEVRHSLKKNALISETKGCVSGWMFCGPWRLNMAVEQLDPQTIKVSSHHHRTCVFKKQEPMVISDSDSALLKRVK
jgi:hypothetical protein